MRSDKKILITGGSGFIGSHFIKFLLKNERNISIFNIDALTYAGDNRRLEEIFNRQDYHFIKCDIRNKTDLFHHLKDIKPDVIFHFASETHVDNSIKRPANFISTNISGTFNILEYIRTNDCRLIHISTDEIYGERKKRSPLFKESDNFRPSSPYSASKAAQEMLINSYIRTYNIKAVIIRPCNHFGPFQHKEKFIPKCIINAINNRPIPLYADGQNKREWIYVEDGCQAIYQIFKKGKDGEIFNIGSGILLSNIQVAKEILRLTSRSESLIKFIADRPGHDKLYGVNFNRLKGLGFKITIPFSEGIRRTIDWFINFSK